MTSIKNIFKNYTVPCIFIFLGVLGFLISGLSFKMVLNDIIERLGRNLFIVLSLIIPITAGMGINFALTVGAMAGQLAIIAVVIMNIEGIFGTFTAFLISLPIAFIFGLFIGILMNKTKGREMITGLIAGYFFSGIYQLIIILIPVNNPVIGVEGGRGIKCTIDLGIIKYSLDRFPTYIRIMGIKIPLFTLFICGLLCVFIWYLSKTKLGHHMKITGLDIKTAEERGINVNRVRVIAIILSTVFAAWGQIISLQNIGTLSTFGSHDQVGIYAAAAILVGGASIKKAGFMNAIVGTLLFYLLFIVAPKAGTNIFNDPQIGEFFRVFMAYGVIVVALYINNKRNRDY